MTIERESIGCARAQFVLIAYGMVREVERLHRSVVPRAIAELMA